MGEGTNNGGVFDTEVRQRVGVANVHRRERRTEHAEEQAQIGPGAARGGIGRSGSPAEPVGPAFGPRIARIRLIRIRALPQRRQGFRPRPHTTRSRYVHFRQGHAAPPPPPQHARPRRRLAPAPPRTGRGKPASNFLLQGREKPVLPLHFCGGKELT